jgi:hypothetical protein
MSHSYESTAHDPTHRDTRPKKRTSAREPGSRGAGEPGSRGAREPGASKAQLMDCLAAAGQGASAAPAAEPQRLAPAPTRPPRVAGIAHTTHTPAKVQAPSYLAYKFIDS